MVQKIVNATYTETVDLNTAIGELSLLAVHTPTAEALKSMFKGFFMNYRKYKINGCNINMVCASRQEITPDLVGLEAGQIDPRDVLNPILFKACTGESLSILLDQIYNHNDAVLDTASVGQHIDTSTLAKSLYYAMLGDDTWRKSHPQSGLQVTGLRPFVHKVVTTQPFKWNGVAGNTFALHNGVTDRPIIGHAGTGNNSADRGGTPYGFGAPSGVKESDAIDVNPSVFVSNGVTEMPWLDTCSIREVSTLGVQPQLSLINRPANAIINDVPRVYMGCIVLPPAILQRLFFRMQISWSISFRDFRPAWEVGPLNGGNATIENSNPYGLYFNYYHSAVPEAKGDAGEFGKELGSFTTTENTEVEPVNETGY